MYKHWCLQQQATSATELSEAYVTDVGGVWVGAREAEVDLVEAEL